jgi:hypothetical protein
MILATNTQICGRGPIVSLTKASYEIRRGSPDAVCRSRLVGGSLSGSPAVMSRLAIDTEAAVSVVTRCDLSDILPLAFRLLSVLVCTLVV